MSSIDDRIREALGEPVDTSDLRTMVGDAFKGRMRWLNVFTVFWSLVIFAIGLYATHRFFVAPDTRAQLRWGLGVLFCLQVVGLMKVWAWMQLEKVALLREVKRLEVRIAHANTLDRDNGHE